MAAAWPAADWERPRPEEEGRPPPPSVVGGRHHGEFSPKTAEEAQEALRSVFGPMIETMLKAELEATWATWTTTRAPDGPNRRNGYTRKVQ